MNCYPALVLGGSQCGRPNARDFSVHAGELAVSLFSAADAHCIRSKRVPRSLSRCSTGHERYAKTTQLRRTYVKLGTYGERVQQLDGCAWSDRLARPMGGQRLLPYEAIEGRERRVLISSQRGPLHREGGPAESLS